jgi:hypothetical protein
MKQNILFALLLFITILVTIQCSSRKNHQFDSREYWRRELNEILTDTSRQFYVDTLITNEKTALAIAEPILAAKYGQAHINREKPFVAIRVDNYWIVDGTLLRGYVGGTATVILRATDGKVMQLTHYK